MSSVIEFVLAALVTLASSAVLVIRWEKVGARLGFTQAILGLTTALAANTPEITSAITALHAASATSASASCSDRTSSTLRRCWDLAPWWLEESTCTVG